MLLKSGKFLPPKYDLHGEFIGMIRLAPKGANIFKKHFHQAKNLHDGKPFQRSTELKKKYIKDMIKEMADLAVPIHCVIIERGWKEIDTVENYQNALKAFEEIAQ